MIRDQDTNALGELASLAHTCAIEINPHRNVYQSIEDYTDDRRGQGEFIVPLEEIVAKDCLVVVDFCQDTPVGSVRIFGNDPIATIQRAIEWIKTDRGL